MRANHVESDKYASTQQVQPGHLSMQTNKPSLKPQTDHCGMVAKAKEELTTHQPPEDHQRPGCVSYWMERESL